MGLLINLLKRKSNLIFIFELQKLFNSPSIKAYIYYESNRPKAKPISELVKIAEENGLDNVTRSRKQDIIFSILKRHAKVAKIFMEMVF